MPKVPTGRRGLRLAIADPPYPPFNGSGGIKKRASRWYGANQRSLRDVPADFHSQADEWDDPKRHRRLLLELIDKYDGFAIATSVDGMNAYCPLPVEMRVMAWVKPNAAPGSHRLKSGWEPVLLFPPISRRSNRGGVGMVSDVLVANISGAYRGAKPEAWTHWILDALTYDPSNDQVDDLFPGSGAVSVAVESYGRVRVNAHL